MPKPHVAISFTEYQYRPIFSEQYCEQICTYDPISSNHAFVKSSVILNIHVIVICFSLSKKDLIWLNLDFILSGTTWMGAVLLLLFRTALAVLDLEGLSRKWECTDHFLPPSKWLIFSQGHNSWRSAWTMSFSRTKWRKKILKSLMFCTIQSLVLLPVAGERGFWFQEELPGFFPAL